MKPGLLTVLACPICKFYPLELKIFKWETKIEEIEGLENILSEKKIEKLNKDIKVKINKNSNEIKIKDNIARSEINFNDYITEIKKIINDIEAIYDESKTFSNNLLDIIKNKLLDSIKKYEMDENLENQRKFFELIEFHIYLLNWYLFFAEIEEGILICNKCNRWFPIIETIPQMLPDDVRSKKPEKEFLLKWKDSIEERVVIKGKPFNLKS